MQVGLAEHRRASAQQRRYDRCVFPGAERSQCRCARRRRVVARVHAVLYGNRQSVQGPEGQAGSPTPVSGAGCLQRARRIECNERVERLSLCAFSEQCGGVALGGQLTP